MRAMRVERADPALLVAEQDDLLAEELFLARQIFQLLGEADGGGVHPSGCPARRRSARNRVAGSAVHKPISSLASHQCRGSSGLMQTPRLCWCQRRTAAIRFRAAPNARWQILGG